MEGRNATWFTAPERNECGHETANASQSLVKVSIFMNN